MTSGISRMTNAVRPRTNATCAGFRRQLGPRNKSAPRGKYRASILFRRSRRMRTERFEMRVPEAFLVAIDGWRRKQPDMPPRAEAVRRLVEAALTQPAPTVLTNDPQQPAHLRDLIEQFFVEDPERLNKVSYLLTPSRRYLLEAEGKEVSAGNVVEWIFSNRRYDEIGHLAFTAFDFLEQLKRHTGPTIEKMRALLRPIAVKRTSRPGSKKPKPPAGHW
jgi:hypothetical protein